MKSKTIFWLNSFPKLSHKFMEYMCEHINRYHNILEEKESESKKRSEKDREGEDWASTSNSIWDMCIDRKLEESRSSFLVVSFYFRWIMRLILSKEKWSKRYFPWIFMSYMWFPFSRLNHCLKRNLFSSK